MSNLKFKVFDTVVVISENQIGRIIEVDGRPGIRLAYHIDLNERSVWVMENDLKLMRRTCPENSPKETTSKQQIELVCDSFKSLLLYKNEKYGDSALHPINVFSKASAETGLLQRLDDKIARIKNSPELQQNDAIDAVGYLVLLCVSRGWTDFEQFKD